MAVDCGIDSPINILEDMLNLHARHTGESLGGVENLILTGDGLQKNIGMSADNQRRGLWLSHSCSLGARRKDFREARSEGIDRGGSREGNEDSNGYELHRGYGFR